VRDRASRERLGEIVQEFESLGARLKLGEDYLEDLNEDIIFRTPGLSPNTPQLRRAVERGSELTSEMELFFRTCPCQLIGVTGSDGKTTTTTIIAEFLKEAGYNVYVGGNIGRPLLPDVDGMEADDVAVLELSSFQLMTMDQSPNIAVFTNLSPNHLDYHGSMGEYIAAKENIFLHQEEGDRAIFNFDNQTTRDLSKAAKGGVTYFSRQQPLDEGVYLRDGAIWLTNDQGSREVLPLDEIRLPGVHNIENYMAAIAAVDGMVPDRCVREVARRFGGVEHRIELVRTRKGVRWYNDSIASSPSRTIAGLNSFQEKVILIAGGKDKGIPYDSLGPVVNDHVKLLILCGATAGVIRRSVEQASNYQGLEIVDVNDYQEAVSLADSRSQAGDVVILSPASTSFDRFANFMERGKTFKAIVNELD
jgi:UDP-N-acetylmuramoylalanine--D-glutamate ligase